MKRNIENYRFYNPTKGSLSFQGVLDEMIDWIKEKPSESYEVIVGCDSSSGEEPDFPVALVILRRGQGGRFFLKKIKYKDKKFYNWKERILQEVLISCDVALVLRENLKKRILEENISPHLEFNYIHADVGGNGATKDMIKEIVGLIRSNGFKAKIKPESYVASIVADRFS